ncbi:hypothetical protein JHK84_043732 [Glycine max]|nr:hypothetical protein JHK84_043732 [Glycine max]
MCRVYEHQGNLEQKSRKDKVSGKVATMPHPKVFFYMTIGGQLVGRIMMELYANMTPRTAGNFYALYTDEKGVRQSCKPLHYKGSSFHRVILSFMCQGGHFTSEKGSGSKLIYGAKFAVKKHTGPNIRSMENASPITNRSQFFICAEKTKWLDEIGR